MTLCAVLFEAKRHRIAEALEAADVERELRRLPRGNLLAVRRAHERLEFAGLAARIAQAGTGHGGPGRHPILDDDDRVTANKEVSIRVLRAARRGGAKVYHVPAVDVLQRLLVAQLVDPHRAAAHLGDAGAQWGPVGIPEDADTLVSPIGDDLVDLPVGIVGIRIDRPGSSPCLSLTVIGDEL